MCWVSIKVRCNFVVSVSHFTHHSNGHQITPWIFVLRFRQRLMTQGELLIPVSWSGKNQVLWCSWTRRSQAQWLPALVGSGTRLCVYMCLPLNTSYEQLLPKFDCSSELPLGYPKLLNHHPQWSELGHWLLVIEKCTKHGRLEFFSLWRTHSITAYHRETFRAPLVKQHFNFFCKCWHFTQ